MGKSIPAIRSYWDQILWECQNKENPNGFFAFTELHQKSEPLADRIEETPTPYTVTKKSCRQRYYLDKNKGKKGYLTPREADCMRQLLHGKTSSAIGEVLNLSKRSVEFYIDNMRNKLNCRSRKELIQMIQQTDFLQWYDNINST